MWFARQSWLRASHSSAIMKKTVVRSSTLFLISASTLAMELGTIVMGRAEPRTVEPMPPVQRSTWISRMYRLCVDFLYKNTIPLHHRVPPTNSERIKVTLKSQVLVRIRRELDGKEWKIDPDSRACTEGAARLGSQAQTLRWEEETCQASIETQNSRYLFTSAKVKAPSRSASGPSAESFGAPYRISCNTK